MQSPRVSRRSPSVVGRCLSRARLRRQDLQIHQDMLGDIDNGGEVANHLAVKPYGPHRFAVCMHLGQIPSASGLPASRRATYRLLDSFGAPRNPIELYRRADLPNVAFESDSEARGCNPRTSVDRNFRSALQHPHAPHAAPPRAARSRAAAAAAQHAEAGAVGMVEMDQAQGLG